MAWRENFPPLEERREEGGQPSVSGWEETARGRWGRRRLFRAVERALSG